MCSRVNLVLMRNFTYSRNDILTFFVSNPEFYVFFSNKLMKQMLLSRTRKVLNKWYLWHFYPFTCQIYLVLLPFCMTCYEEWLLVKLCRTRTRNLLGTSTLHGTSKYILGALETYQKFSL